MKYGYDPSASGAAVFGMTFDEREDCGNCFGDIPFFLIYADWNTTVSMLLFGCWGPDILHVFPM